MMWKIYLILSVLFILQGLLIKGYELDEKDNSTRNGKERNEGEEEEKGIHLVAWNIHEVQHYLTWSVFVMSVILLKLIYHFVPFISGTVPESCILIGLGSIFGAVTQLVSNKHILDHWKLNPVMFFYFLLPPIVLEASFALFNRTFGNNLPAVLLFAVIGTLMNFVIIGMGMYGIAKTGIIANGELFKPLHSFLFSAVIVAVDPVAVLAIFQEIGVDQTLYFLVFGEALLNDAVTVVLYDITIAFLNLPEVSITNLILGTCSFFTVSCGALLVGSFVGVVCCLVTKYTAETPVLEPLIIFSFGYFSYIAGDLFKWSGIISMIACGVIQAAYAFNNISETSLVTVHRLAIMIASICEAMIFLFLGIELFSGQLEFNKPFALFALLLCLLSRGFVTVILTVVINFFNLAEHNISFSEQFILTYGGLRGAVAYSLATLIDARSLPNVGVTKNVFNTTTLFVILFTVCVMGVTMKPIVRILKIKLEPVQQGKMMALLNEFVIEHTVDGVNSIIGPFQNNFQTQFEAFNRKVLRRYLQRSTQTHKEKIFEAFKKVLTDVQMQGGMSTPDCISHLAPTNSVDHMRSLNFLYESSEAVDPYRVKRKVDPNDVQSLLHILRDIKSQVTGANANKNINTAEFRQILSNVILTKNQSQTFGGNSRIASAGGRSDSIVVPGSHVKNHIPSHKNSGLPTTPNPSVMKPSIPANKNKNSVVKKK